VTDIPIIFSAPMVQALLAGRKPHDITAVGVEERSDLMPRAVQCFRKLWIHINGREAWETNPWVVAPSFRVIKANIDAPEAVAA
jgi:hypothetical protein